MRNKMQSRRSARSENTPRRRKIAVACEPCRERKSRCDGQKPICGPCTRRGYPVDRCVFKASNVRSANDEEYLQSLHNRIRELEETCKTVIGSAPGSTGPIPEDHQETENPIGALSSVPTDPGRHEPEPAQTSTPVCPPRSHLEVPEQGANAYSSSRTDTDQYAESPFARSNITAMGFIDPVQERPFSRTNEYFGSSSTASLMRLLARGSVRGSKSVRNSPSRHAPGTSQFNTTSNISLPEVEPTQPHHIDSLLLPPRDLADHLLDCFWDRIYSLYPFFDRQSFQDAYENLWLPRNQPGKQLNELNIGLGSKSVSGSRSIVFMCSLNLIFAIGCHFANLPDTEKEATSLPFFLRAKQHIGLDLLDVRNIGVVQTLLVAALFLQSTPYPHRCWHSIGVACRVAQGLGLHEAQLDESQDPLEQEIQRRTWHGCVMMDMIVSMTYGRPSMTSHLSRVPLPGTLEAPDSPSTMAFYISTIELYSILDIILSDVYKAWRGRPNTPSSSTLRQGGLAVIIDLEERLLDYESHLPWFLSWRENIPITGPSHLVLSRQRNVLHARYLYLHLLLYRPIFTQLCDVPRNPGNTLAPNTISSTIITKCAGACVRAAIDLVSLVYETYQTSTTDTWWYNGFYTSTAAMVLIMSYTCHTVTDPDQDTVDTVYHKCEEILRHMEPFSISARNTLNFLQTARDQVASASRGRVDTSAHVDDQNTQLDINGTAFADESAQDHLFWDTSMFLVDELGFLGPFDFRRAGTIDNLTT